MINKDILDNAPTGATHWDFNEYMRWDSSDDWECYNENTKEWTHTCGLETTIRALADIKRIEELEYKMKRVSNILFIVKMNPLHDRAMQARRVNAAYEVLEERLK
mgnify:CR=1 FL=1